MILKSIRLALHRLWAFSFNSIISIGGLAIAMAVALAIFSYAFYHYSFDRHIVDGEKTYRLISRYGEGTYNANTFASFDDVISEMSEVESYTVCYTNHQIREIQFGSDKIEVEHIVFADSNFIDFFSVEMEIGDANRVGESNLAFLSSKMAHKLFDNKNPLNEKIFLRSFTPRQDSMIAFTIAGVYKDAPQASHLQYDILLSQKGHFSPTIKILKSRKVFGASVYLKSYTQIDKQSLIQKLKEAILPKLKSAHGPQLDIIGHDLQSLYDIHFTNGLTAEQQTTVKASSINILLIVGLVILIIAAFNFGIIHIARAEYHRKANFIIRLMGAGKIQLFVQAFVEIFISTFLALTIAIYILASFQYFGDTAFFGNYNIAFYSSEFILIMVVVLLILSIVITLLATTDLWKSNSLLSQINQGFKRKMAIVLLIIQFAIVIVLIGFTILINKQMLFIDDKDLGYNPEQLMIIRVPQSSPKVNTLCEELKQMNFVAHTSTAHHYPGYRLQDMTFTNSGNSIPFKFGFVDPAALKTMEIEVLQYFNNQEEDARGGWYINHNFYQQLLQFYSIEQIENSNFPVDEEQGEQEGEPFIILGVISDFHYASLHEAIENFAFHIPEEGGRFNRFVLVRYDIMTAESTESILEKVEEIYPDQPLRYSFMDEQLEAEYQSEKTLLSLINLFSLLSILIACFGLIGLVVFISNQRSKEIGIRKVNGANIREIIYMLNKEVVYWILISFLIATPISYLLSLKWLEGFAFKTTFSWWILVVPGIIALIIGLLTVSWQTYKAARKNPVEALRYE